MRDEAERIAAAIRRALNRRPEPAEVERIEVRRLVRRAIRRQQQRELRSMLRAAFARVLTGLAEAGWVGGNDGRCIACAGDQPRHPFWPKRRSRYIVCPRGHRLHLECLELRTTEREPGIEATCPRCPKS